MKEGTDLVMVYAGSPVDAEMIKEILEDYGIPVNIKNQLMGTIAPWQVSGGGASPAEVEVFTKDKEQALLLIEEFHKSANN